MASKPSSSRAAAGRSEAGYGEASIRVLKGLEPVKQRPGMYTRTDNPLHIVQEVIDNAADEALAGHGRRIAVTVHADGSVSVEDDGRGIPIGLHPEEKVPVVEIVFTRLHAGGKFDKGSGGAYSFSGGLHGVGVSVTNALARRLEVTVWRDGQVASLAFSGGDVIEPLSKRKAGPEDRNSGTTVRVWPDAKYFESAELPKQELVHLLRSKAVLMPGVTVTLTYEKSGETQTWRYQGGLRDYLLQTLPADPVISLFEGEHYARESETENFAEGEGAAWCVAFTEEGSPVRESYVNLIPTVAGGTHEAGLKDGLFAAVKNFIDLHSLLPKGVKLMPEDVFSRASFVLSAKVLDPQFQGQTKERLNSRDALRLVSTYVKPAMELWLNQHVDQGKRLAELVIRQAQARQRAGQKVEKKKGSGVAVLPGKLTDCESRDTSHNELFLVEGDSAGAVPRWGATRSSRRCCRCAARCSMRGRSSAIGSLPTTRSTTSRWRSAWTRMVWATSRTSRDCATARSASSRTPTWTARTSRCCCSRSSSVTFRSSSSAGTCTSPGRRCFASMPRRAARSPRPSSTRWTRGARGHPRQAAQGGVPRGGVDDQPLQGPGRDERGAVVGNHAEPGHAAAAAGTLWRPGLRGDRELHEQADGQGRGPGPA